MTQPPETVTRLDAARRQLCLAIRLFFAESDTVSIHTLACAAHEILGKLTRFSKEAMPNAGGFQGSMLFDNPYILPEKKKEYQRVINRDRNFFKHSGKDPSESVSFKSETTEFFLFDASAMYESLTTRQLFAGSLFCSWFFLSYPKMVAEDTPMKSMIEKILGSSAGLSQATRRDFLEFLDDREVIVHAQRLGMDFFPAKS